MSVVQLYGLCDNFEIYGVLYEKAMNNLGEYSYIWETDKEKYVLVDDELGKSIFFIKDKEIMFFLLEDEVLLNLIICKMIECRNKKYSSFVELQKAIQI